MKQSQLQQKKQLQLTKSISDFRKTHTLSETGKKFGLSSERVRQIGLTKSRKRCSTHNRYYYNACSHCLSVTYKTLLYSSDYAFIEKEVKKESKNRKRDFLSVQRRKYLIQILHEMYGMSFSKIGLLLKRHHSSISNLYE